MSGNFICALIGDRPMSHANMKSIRQVYEELWAVKVREILLQKCAMDVKALTLKLSILYYYYYCWITSNIVKTIIHIQQLLIKHSIRHL